MRKQNGEKKAVRYLLRQLKEKGFVIVGVYDGKTLHHPTTEKDTMIDIFDLDESSIRVVKGTGAVHGILIVLGNDESGSEVVADWNYTDGDPDGFDAAMQEITKVIFHLDE